MTESRAQRPTIDQIEDRVSVVKQLRERFKEDKVYLRTLDADLLCLQMTLNWRRGEQKSKAIDNGPIRRDPGGRPSRDRIHGRLWAWRPRRRRLGSRPPWPITFTTTLSRTRTQTRTAEPGGSSRTGLAGPAFHR